MKERDQEIEDIKALMSTELGRRFMARLTAATGFYQDLFTGNSTTFYNLGRRSIGVLLIAEITVHCPEQYPRMLEEFRLFKKQFKGKTDGKK